MKHNLKKLAPWQLVWLVMASVTVIVGAVACGGAGDNGSDPTPTALITATEIDIFSNDYVSLDFAITTDRNVSNVVFGLFPSGSSPASADAVRGNTNKRTRNLVAGTNENLLISQSSASVGDAVLTPNTAYELWYALSSGSTFGKLLDASTEALTGTIGMTDSFTADSETRAIQYRADERMLVSFVINTANFNALITRRWQDTSQIGYLVNAGVTGEADKHIEAPSTNGDYSIFTFVKKTYQFGENLRLDYSFFSRNLPLTLDN